MARGGYQRPSSPAAVSGPGALSARTDGGAGQPIRVAPGGPYGSRQQLEGQQGAAPMRSGGAPPLGPGGPGAGAPPGPPPGGDVFAPTERPGEPITAGVPVGPGPNGATLIPDDPYEAVRAVYAAYPHPDLAELLEGEYRA